MVDNDGILQQTPTSALRWGFFNILGFLYMLGAIALLWLCQVLFLYIIHK